MKRCPKCQKRLRLDEFYKDRKRNDGLSVDCKVCRKEDSKIAYQRNSGVYKRRTKLFRIKNSKELKRLISEIRTKYGCCFCREKTDCILDFHHYEHRKKVGGDPVSRAIHRGRGALFREINKCAVVCSNCHRKVHAGLLKVSKDMVCHEEVVYKPRLYLPVTRMRRCVLHGTPCGAWVVIFQGPWGKEKGRIVLKDDHAKAKFAAYSRRVITPNGWTGNPEELAGNWRAESLKKIRRCPQEYFDLAAKHTRLQQVKEKRSPRDFHGGQGKK